MDAGREPASAPRLVRDPAQDVFGEGGAIDVMFHPKRSPSSVRPPREGFTLSIDTADDPVEAELAL